MRRYPIKNIVLFLITLLTTLIAGYWQEKCSGLFELLGNPLLLYKGIPFSFTLLLILGAHEWGHYLMAKKRGVRATLPFFIPSPHPLVGTFGAFIKMKSPVPDRRALIDIAAAGPLAGFLMACLAMIIGIELSEIQAGPLINETASLCNVSVGSSLLISFLGKSLLGHLPPSHLISLHPVAFAAWIGLFVTALNLMPIGQLDGGHIIYAFIPKTYRRINLLFFLFLFPLGVLWQGWFIWGLILFFFGLRHPPLMEEHSSLDLRRKVTGAFALFVFFITFVPIPFTI